MPTYFKFQSTNLIPTRIKFHFQNYVETGSPICVFYFSHPFAIGPQSGWSRSLTDENEISLPVTKTPNTQKTPKTEQHPQQHQQSVNPEYKTLRHKHNRTANGNLRPIKRIGNKCAIVKKRSSWTLVRYLTGMCKSQVRWKFDKGDALGPREKRQSLMCLVCCWDFGEDQVYTCLYVLMHER